MADKGRARYSRVQPGTFRYSAEKTHHVLYFRKAGASRISNMILRGMSRVSTPGHFWDIIWGMSGASSGACLGIIWGTMYGASYGACMGHHILQFRNIIWGMSGACLRHHMGHFWGIICDMSGASSRACLGQSKISPVLHASLMAFLIYVFDKIGL